MRKMNTKAAMWMPCDQLKVLDFGCRDLFLLVQSSIYVWFGSGLDT